MQPEQHITPSSSSAKRIPSGCLPLLQCGHAAFLVQDVLFQSADQESSCVMRHSVKETLALECSARAWRASSLESHKAKSSHLHQFKLHSQPDSTYCHQGNQGKCVKGILKWMARETHDISHQQSKALVRLSTAPLTNAWSAARHRSSAPLPMMPRWWEKGLLAFLITSKKPKHSSIEHTVTMTTM